MMRRALKGNFYSVKLNQFIENNNSVGFIIKVGFEFEELSEEIACKRLYSGGSFEMFVWI